MSAENRGGRGGRGGIGSGRGDKQYDLKDRSRTGNMIAQSKTGSDEKQAYHVQKTNRDTHMEPSTEVNTRLPPASPSLLPQRPRGSSFGIQTQGVDTRQELKLSIEFPLSQRKSASCRYYFKLVMTYSYLNGKVLRRTPFWTMPMQCMMRTP